MPSFHERHAKKGARSTEMTRFLRLTKGRKLTPSEMKSDKDLWTWLMELESQPLRSTISHAYIESR